MAAKAKAQVEARYVIAYNRPRSILQARSDILAACQRPGFAESARYRKPVGNTTIDGFSIRFAEEAIKAMKNISVESTTIYEDEHKRTVQISVTDLESNLTYGKEVTVAKTVERQNLKPGQSPISKRINSYGKTVYLVEATEDDIANKVASAESKIIRNCGLRLIPSDILEEAEDAINETLEKGGRDPRQATKKIVDNFAKLNIGASELEKYLKHPLDSISPKELNNLRAIFSAVRDGEASWTDYITGESPAKTKPDLSPKAAPESDGDGDLGPQVEQPKKETKSENAAKDSHPAPAENSKQSILEATISGIGVTFDSFVEWVSGSGRVARAGLEAGSEKQWQTWTDIPDAICDLVLPDTRGLKNLQTVRGTK